MGQGLEEALGLAILAASRTQGLRPTGEAISQLLLLCTQQSQVHSFLGLILALRERPT